MARRSGQCALRTPIAGSHPAACTIASRKSPCLWREASRERPLETTSCLEYVPCFRSISCMPMSLLLLRRFHRFSFFVTFLFVALSRPLSRQGWASAIEGGGGPFPSLISSSRGFFNRLLCYISSSVLKQAKRLELLSIRLF